MLLPYLEQKSLYAQYDFRKTWLSSMTDMTDHSMWPLNQTVLPTLICPSASRSTTTIGGSGTFMAGAPTDYSFSHGADIIRALPGPEAACPGARICSPKSARGWVDDGITVETTDASLLTGVPALMPATLT